MGEIAAVASSGVANGSGRPRRAGSAAASAPAASGWTAGKRPSKSGSNAGIRSASGGCVAKRFNKRAGKGVAEEHVADLRRRGRRGSASRRPGRRSSSAPRRFRRGCA